MKGRMIFIISLLILMFFLFFMLYFLGFANLVASGSDFFVKYKWLDFGKPIIAVFYLIILSIFFIVVVAIMFRLVISLKNDAPVYKHTVAVEDYQNVDAPMSKILLSEKSDNTVEPPPVLSNDMISPIPDESVIQSRIDNVYQNFSQMTSEILQCLDISELFEKILFWGAGLSHSKRASIMVVDKNKQLYVYKTMGWSIDEKQQIKDIKVAVGEEICGKVAADNKRVYVSNIDNYEGHDFKYKEHYKTKSFVSIPIYGMHRVVAVLNLTENKNGYYSVNDLEGLNIMSGIASKLFELIQYKRRLDK